MVFHTMDDFSCKSWVVRRRGRIDNIIVKLKMANDDNKIKDFEKNSIAIS